MKTLTFFLLLIGSSFATAQSVVINEVYGAGGNAGALFTHDFIELYNNGATPVDLTGWSVQYASATGTGTWQVTLLSGVIEPGRTFLIQEAGGVNGSPLPPADVTGTLSMAATAGKVALVQSLTPLSGTCPLTVLVIDLAGYGGSANCFEGTGPTPAPSATLSAQRLTDGADTNDNAVDFLSAAPTPTNSLPRSQVITFTTLGSHTYGDASFGVTASASSGLPVVITSADPSIASVAGATVTILGAGDVDITASQAGDGIFEPATAVQSLHIAKAILNVTVVSTSRPEGVANPLFQIQYSGFVGSDTESVLDVPPVASCAADMASLPGDYPIFLSGGTDNNYEFTYSPGVLVVLPSAPASPAYVLTPADGAQDVFVNPLIKCSAVSGAMSYVLQVSDDPSFANSIELHGGRLIKVTGLNYGTNYFARVRTDQTTEFGRSTRFTTGNPEQFAILASPTSRTEGVGLSTTLIFADVPGASLYSYELSSSSAFMTIISSGIGGRRQGVTGLQPGTTYFIRVRTDLSPQWGPLRSFHTAPLTELCYVRYPVERFLKVSWLPEFVLNDVGAPGYVVQLSEVADFASVIEFGPVGVKFTLATPLKFRTQYYTRVRSAELPDQWGPMRSFTTAHPADFSYIRTPADGSEGVDTLARVVLAPVPGATNYELSMSTSPDFADESRRDASERALRIALQPFTTYFARGRTNLSQEWGMVTRFTTMGGGKTAASVREATVGGLAMEEEPVGAEEPEQTSVLAYPNPFAERMTLCPGQEAAVSVSDLQGRVIFIRQVSARECCEMGDGWSPGVYVGTLVTASGRLTIRLVKN
jgi:hypothetical protein